MLSSVNNPNGLLPYIGLINRDLKTLILGPHNNKPTGFDVLHNDKRRCHNKKNSTRLF